MYMRASGASELRNVLHFHTQKLLFLSIFCWYFRNFVGTNYILVGLHVPTDFQMYTQNSEKALLGGQFAPPAPPPPSGYALLTCYDILLCLSAWARRCGRPSNRLELIPSLPLTEVLRLDVGFRIDAESWLQVPLQEELMISYN